MFGRYGAGREEMPRVMHISIARYNRALPEPGEALEFLVSIHEEGTGITWQQNVTVETTTEQQLLELTNGLHLWSLNRAHTPETARGLLRQLGRQLYETFIGPGGEKILQALKPTAFLFNIDETILNLPWELIATANDALSQQTPFGRLVTTRTHLQRGRDPLEEDTVVRILAAVNPTADLAVAEAGLAALNELAGRRGSFSIELDVLTRNEASREKFAEMLAVGDYDILHFAGHASFDPDLPGGSALRLADSVLTADDVLRLPWKAPPYFVFNSACESGRAAAGQRLVSGESQSNGLAAAFLAAGVQGYAGYFWPVTDTGAGIFTRTFYESLFMRENVGFAFLEARRDAVRELDEVADLTGYSAILFGDAASKHRRDLAMAA
jgi:CHAT domain-containing protein